MILSLIFSAAALAFVQLGSDAIFSRAGTARSLPAHLQPAVGVRIYRGIERVAPAPYVHAMLARAALDSGDLTLAERHARALPASSRRSDLLGRIAQSRGDHERAEQYFIAADDVFAIGDEVESLAQRDPQRAYRVQELFVHRLQRTATHPDALAEAYWRLGVLASKLGRPALAMTQYGRAVALSPLSAKYLIAAGFQAYDLRDLAAAQRDFAQAISIDPSSADAYAGAGMAALRLGNRAAAERFAARSRAIDPGSHPLHTLESQLQ